MTRENNAVHPVIMSGGSGTRLWPLSRKSYPKQFSVTFDDKSLFQKSVERLVTSNRLRFHPPVTLTNADFRFIVGEQLSALGISNSTIMIEPEGRNTAPAILAATLSIAEKDPEAIILISPSDHLIDDISAFHDAIATGIESAELGNIVLFGIMPTHAETGYGYMALSPNHETGAVPLEAFVEKPDSATAEQLISSGNHLWNAGIFLFKASTMLAAFKKLMPALVEQVEAALEQSVSDLDFIRLAPEPWSKCDSISIDYAIMERITNRTAVQLDCPWRDLGDWEAIWAHSKPDEKGVVTSSNATAIECSDVLLRSESDNQHLVGLGLNNIIAVAMSDAVLVAHKDRAQDLRLVVAQLKKQSNSQAETYPVDHRPWGWFETLILTKGFQVKRIFVKPDAALSLQSHKHRSEHWVVIRGTATVTINDDVTDLYQGQSTFIPLGAIHRLENKQSDNLEIIEIQLGDYLGEDDIIRYEDIYSR